MPFSTAVCVQNVILQVNLYPSIILNNKLDIYWSIVNCFTHVLCTFKFVAFLCLALQQFIDKVRDTETTVAEKPAVLPSLRQQCLETGLTPSVR
jgi:hypothetical protein